MNALELKAHYQHRVERARQEAYDADLALQMLASIEQMQAQLAAQNEHIKALEAKIAAGGMAC